MLLPDAIGETAAGHEQDQHRRIQDEHTSRNDRGEPEHHQHHGNGDRAQGNGQHDTLQVRKACKAPKAPIQAECKKNPGLKRKYPGERIPDIGNLRLMKLEIEAQPIQPDPRDRRGDDVVGERQPGSPVSPYFHGIGRRSCATNNQSSHTCRRE